MWAQVWPRTHALDKPEAQPGRLVGVAAVGEVWSVDFSLGDAYEYIAPQPGAITSLVIPLEYGAILIDDLCLEGDCGPSPVPLPSSGRLLGPVVAALQFWRRRSAFPAN